MVGVKARIDGAESGERAHEQARANEEECGQRDLKTDNRLPDRAAAFYSGGNLCPQRRDCRSEPEQRAGRRRNQRGKSEYLPVEMCGKSREGAASGIGERETAGAASC